VSLTAWPRRIVRAARCRAGPRLRLRLRPRPRLQSPSGRRPASRRRPRAPIPPLANDSACTRWLWSPSPPGTHTAVAAAARRDDAGGSFCGWGGGRRGGVGAIGRSDGRRCQARSRTYFIGLDLGVGTWSLEDHHRNTICALRCQHKQQQIEGSSCAWGGEAM